jgi:hypothetical protein
MVKRICKLLLLIVFAVSVISSLAMAEYLPELMPYRPSYQNLYKKCSGHIEHFKHELYIDVARQSYSNLSISPEALEARYLAGGIDPDLNLFLQDEVTAAALGACFNNQDEENSFIRNLLIIDATVRIGMFVAIYSGGKFALSKLPKLLPILHPIARQTLTVGLALGAVKLYIDTSAEIYQYLKTHLTQTNREAEIQRLKSEHIGILEPGDLSSIVQNDISRTAKLRIAAIQSQLKLMTINPPQSQNQPTTGESKNAIKNIIKDPTRHASVQTSIAREALELELQQWQTLLSSSIESQNSMEQTQ